MSEENNEIISADDDFEKLLQSFINSNIDDADEKPAKKTEEVPEPKKDASSPSLSEEGKRQNEEASRLFEQELANTFAEVRNDIEREKNTPTLKSEESELAQAFINYKTSIEKLVAKHLQQKFETKFFIDLLYPNYKPSVGRILSYDLAAGWTALCKMFPNDVGKFPVTSSDEEFLNFAEKLRDQDLQLAVISYVEILIDMEGCEITYQMKLAKYQEQHIKKIMYEEYLARKERQKRFIEILQTKNFPIDVEKLISNYFRVAQKDADGAYKALITNPAVFAPIDFSKIKPRFFGLVKVSPKDGIRVNKEIGDFLKNIKA